MNKNPLSLQEPSHVERKVLTLHKLQQNHFELKKDNPSERNWLGQLILLSFSHIKQIYQESLIQGIIHNQFKLTRFAYF